jgi:hypothetical protein
MRSSKLLFPLFYVHILIKTGLLLKGFVDYNIMTVFLTTQHIAIFLAHHCYDFKAHFT